MNKQAGLNKDMTDMLAIDENKVIQKDRQRCCSFLQEGVIPLIELPPLSPGIQARVMEEVEVVETVRRGWSGGTADEML